MKNLDLSSLVKERIKSFEKKISSLSTGKVVSVGDGVANVIGLKNVKLSEVLEFPNNLFGMALSLEENFVSVILFGQDKNLKEGDVVKKTDEIVKVGVGDELIGRIVDPLGNSIDGKGKIKFKKHRLVESEAPNIMNRKSVHQPFETGILSIDSMVPIGKGQRELIIGDRKTGKTSICVDSILNQKGKNVKCVYVSIGQKNSTLAFLVQKLEKAGAMEYTTIVSANSSSPNSLQYLAPFSAMSIAEEWMYKGEDVVVFFDDLSKHAVSYRSLTLLLRRPPGREAYPGDVFYLHSRLLERAAKLNDENKGGSITAIPIVETKAGDISAYIPTNIISITDGQLFLLSDLFNSGQRPAIDPGLSVSRVGSSSQTKLIKKYSSSLKLELANYNELKSFSEFSSELDEETKKILDRGKKILTFLKQKQYSPLSFYKQVIILISIFSGVIDNIDFDRMEAFKKKLLSELESNNGFLKYKKKINNDENLSNQEELDLIEKIRKIK